MTTPNPRITVTLTPSTHSILRELSALTGDSVSALVGDLLATNEPVFQRMNTVLRAAKEVREEGRTQMVEVLAKAQVRLEKHLGIALESMDNAAQLPLLDTAERVVRRKGRAVAATRATGGGASAHTRGARGGAASQPPYLTGGSGFEKPVQKPSKEKNKTLKGGNQ